jgi:hypothetical protein
VIFMKFLIGSLEFNLHIFVCLNSTFWWHCQLTYFDYHFFIFTVFIVSFSLLYWMICTFVGVISKFVDFALFYIVQI